MKVIELTKGQAAIVDDEDFEYLAQWRWCFANGYAMRRGKRLMLMHREIIGINCLGMEIDHINGIGTDNRRCNLRICTSRQNGYNRKNQSNNTTGFKGVSRHKQDARFRARIRMPDGKYRHLGMFETAEEASSEYVSAARELHGEFFRQN